MQLCYLRHVHGCRKARDTLQTTNSLTRVVGNYFSARRVAVGILFQSGKPDNDFKMPINKYVCLASSVISKYRK